MASYPIVGWSTVGSEGINFTLFHNSKGAYSFDLGKGWSHTYDLKITHTVGSSAILRLGDGEEIPFTETSGTFIPPAGIFFDLVLNVDGTWALTNKKQIVFKFNNTGHLIEIVDRNNNSVYVQRDTLNKITEVEDASGRSIEFAYTSSGLIEEVVDPLGRLWTFVYDGSNNLVEIEYPELSALVHSRVFTYNSASDILTETDLRGKTWTYTYDSSENLLTFTNPLGKTWSYTYGSSAVVLTHPDSNSNTQNYSSGLVASTVDESGFSNSFVYNGDKRVTTFTDKRGKTWAYTYDGQGNVLTETSPLGRVVTCTYNLANDLLTLADSGGTIAAWTYDVQGNVTKAVDGLGRTIQEHTLLTNGLVSQAKDALNRTHSFTYDTYGNLLAVTKPEGTSESQTYDILGRLVTQTSSAGFVTTNAYDEWGRVTSISPPGGTALAYEYDLAGNVIEVIDGLSRSSGLLYDDAGRLVSVINPKGDIVSQVLNDRGFVTSVTDARGKVKSFAYSARGDLASLALADGSTESWTYDGSGNNTFQTNGMGETIGYEFDDDGNLIKKDYLSGVDTVLSYDTSGRVSTMVDATGSSQWTYNGAGELTQLVTPSSTISYTYNLDGQRATRTVAGIGTTSYGYDSHGRLTSVTEPSGDTVSYVFNALNGRLFRKNFPSGVHEIYSFDNSERLTRNQVRNASNAVIWDYQYVYDLADQLVQSASGGVTTSYTYDLAGHILSEQKTGGITHTIGYTYDANGNRLTRTSGGVTETYTYDDADKLLSIVGGVDPRTYTYDAAGRPTAIARTASTTNFLYNADSKPVQISNTSNTTSYGYNGTGALTQLNSSLFGSKALVRDGSTVYTPVIQDGTAGFSGSGEVRSGQRTWFHSGIKNTEFQTSSSGVASGARHYDSFGSVLGSSGSFKSQFGYGGSFGYQEDTGYGAFLLGHRMYDPSTGRFLTRDPSKQGANWYLYSAGQPQLRADVDGNLWIPLAKRITYLYKLIDKDTGEILKYGITCREVPTKRYSQKFYDKNNAEMQVDFVYDNRRSALDDERILVEEMGGRLNKERWSYYRKLNSISTPSSSGAFYLGNAERNAEKRRSISFGAMEWVPAIGEALEGAKALGNLSDDLYLDSRHSRLRLQEAALSTGINRDY